MYQYKDRMRAVKLYIKYDRSAADTIREIGYPSERMLLNWYEEYNELGKLHQKYCKKSKYSDEKKRLAINYYSEHGRSISRTIRALGYPCHETLVLWIDELLPGERRVLLKNRGKVAYSQEQKKQMVLELCSREISANKVADSFGLSRASLYRWKQQLLPQEEIMTKKKGEPKPRPKDSDALQEEVSSLKKQIHRLRMERDILYKANELLKKEQGINLHSLTNKEKTLLIDALRTTYRLSELIKELKMPRSSYFYHRKSLLMPEKYADLRKVVIEIFHENKSRYGYRRIHVIVGRTGQRVSEKVIRRLMAEEQLAVLGRKRGKYSSYRGEISPAVENIVDRDFTAEAPNVKWLTDITEFNIPAGKVYLSPIIDCFDGLVVSWTLGTTANSELVNSMLDTAILSLTDGEHPIVHSDRGAHYRWPGWLSRMSDACLIRSMSKKGCTPDNAACEGFFGRLKNEMYYFRNWRNITIEGFIDELDCYISWYNEKRIKMSLGTLSPVEYRKSLGLVA